MKKIIYLCGPINGRTDSDCKDWRNAVTATGRFDTLDPMRRDFRGRENEPGIDQEIVDGDIDDINSSHAVLVYFDKPSVGTSMEIYVAWMAKVPVVVIDASGKPLSPWLTFHSNRIVKTMEEALDALGEVLGEKVQQL